jgi:FK506-binding nuclear protein
VVKPGQVVSIVPQGDLVITNAALGAELADPSGRTSVKLLYMRPIKVPFDDEDEEEKGEVDNDQPTVETVLCSFTPGKVYHTISWRVDSRD